MFDGLANTTATLGSFYWLGFETTGLSPVKKRLAWLGAQRRGLAPATGSAPPLQVEVCRHPSTSTQSG
jgi:hypothetical protein